MTIKDLNPKVVWENFYGLTQIPRPSKHEGKVIEYLYNWGIAHGLETIQDETGNIIIRKPATPGMENRRGVILQGHMDMVPQKTSDSGHDFLKDPITTLIDGDWVTADRTTLGADNGIGVAMGLSVLEDPTVKHGPVEVLVTYDEETGMTGANMLAPKYNVRPGYKGLKISVKGLQGGHSGMDISLYRANANKVLARILLPLMELFGVQVVSFTGGSLRNAIPFEAEAEVVVPHENVDAVKKLVKSIFAEVKAEFAESDPGASLAVEAVPAAKKFIQGSVMLQAVKALIACPSGVIRMSRTMEGLTETSINMAIVRTERGRISVHSLMRSAVDSAKADLAERVRCVFELAGADEIAFRGGYSGWTPKLDTPMNKVMMSCFEKVYGKPMKVMATHGGLECALLGAKYPKWEMVSVGPTIKYPHSPDERVSIPSVARTWEYLKEVLANVPEK